MQKCAQQPTKPIIRITAFAVPMAECMLESVLSGQETVQEHPVLRIC